MTRWVGTMTLAGVAVVVCLGTSAMGQSEWIWHSPLPQGYDLNGAWGSGPNDIFAVGNLGTIVHYDGSTWSLIPLVNEGTLNAVWGTAANDVYAVGADPSGSMGQILHYDGAAWSVATTATGVLYGVWGSGPDDIYAVGADGLIVHFNGSGWSPMTSPTGRTIYAIWGTGPNNVWATGQCGVLLHYNGATWWSSGDWAPDLTFRGLSGDGGLGLYLVGYSQSGPSTVQAQIWRTAGGFSCAYRLDSYRFRAVVCTASDNVVVVGTGGKIVRYDGSTWSTTTSPTTYDLNAIWGAEPNNVSAVGSSGAILRYNGSSWSNVSTTVTGGYAEVLPKFSGTGPNDIYLTGYPAKILHYDGASWSVAAPHPSASVNGSWASSPNDVYVVGDGLAMHYDGASWSNVTIKVPTPAHIWDVWGSGPNDVFAVCREGTGQSYMCQYNGVGWSSGPAGIADGISLWGSGPDDVFVVGGSGGIGHYDGSAWSAMTSGTSNKLWDVWGTGPNDVFAVGDGGTIVHYDGTSWSTMSSGTTANLTGVWCSGPHDVFAVGSPA